VDAVTAVVVRESFDGVRCLLVAKTQLYALEHQIADHLARDTAGRGGPGHDLAIAGVECKRDTNALTVPAGDLDAVRCPSQVRSDRDDLAIVGTSWRLARVALQQEAVLRHQSVNAFVAQPRKPCVLTLLIEN
jgi:hypothetical protein